MADKLKPRKILVCPVKLHFFIKLQYERNNKVVCVQRKDLDQYCHYFPLPIGIVGDFDLY